MLTNLSQRDKPPQRYDPAKDYIVGIVGSDEGLEEHQSFISLASSVFTGFLRNLPDSQLISDPFILSFKPVALRIVELSKTKRLYADWDAQKLLERMGVKTAD
jgi:hypothetical protein